MGWLNHTPELIVHSESLQLVSTLRNSQACGCVQRAMSARPGKPPAPDFVNRLLGANFAEMARMGDPVLKPFLQARTTLCILVRHAASTCQSQVSRPAPRVEDTTPDSRLAT